VGRYQDRLAAGVDPAGPGETMNLSDLIQELRERKLRIERTIAALETIWESADSAQPPKRARRGRKTMPEQERADVSKRMKQYWAEWRSRRAQAQPAAATGRRRGGGRSNQDGPASTA
jgi:hypothetical protein